MTDRQRKPPLREVVDRLHEENQMLRESNSALRAELQQAYRALTQVRVCDHGRVKEDKR